MQTPARYWVHKNPPKNAGSLFTRVASQDVFALSSGVRFVECLTAVHNQVILPRMHLHGKRFLVAGDSRRAVGALITVAKQYGVENGILYIVNLGCTYDGDNLDIAFSMGYTEDELMPQFVGEERDIGNSFEWLPIVDGELNLTCLIYEGPRPTRFEREWVI